MFPRRRPWDNTERAQICYVQICALSPSPTQPFISSVWKPGREAKEKEDERNQLLRRRRINWRCTPPTHEGTASSRRQRLMWEAAVAPAQAVKRRRGAACVGRWTAASVEMTGGISVSKKRSVEKQMKSCLGRLTWREDGVLENQVQFHTTCFPPCEKSCGWVSGWAK